MVKSGSAEVRICRHRNEVRAMVGDRVKISCFDGGIYDRRFYFDVSTEFLLRDRPRS